MQLSYHKKVLLLNKVVVELYEKIISTANNNVSQEFNYLILEFKIPELFIERRLSFITLRNQ